jgi:hypothetical protein
MELGIFLCVILISRKQHVELGDEGDHAPLKRDSNHETNCNTKETWWNKKQGHCKFQVFGIIEIHSN